MKKSKIFSTAIAVLLLFSYLPTDSKNVSLKILQPGSQDVTQLVVLVDDNHASKPHGRNQVYIPIIAYYASINSCIYVNFTDYLGDVQVEVENIVTGEYNLSVIDAFEEMATIPLSGDSGHYVVTFTTPGGTVYYSEFEA
ncbi:MAG: DUF3244 domain-containing protein [Rikenellaceae bacterium]|jgi:hypothetical protein|nr:DUF3244 domain-containing protein [Rikenellaceae bacterium]